MGVLYVKLGKGGCWEEVCVKQGTLRLGFGSGEEAMFAACDARDADAMRAELRRMRRKDESESVEDDFRQVDSVFGDDGSTVWITFHDRAMYWGRLDKGKRPTRGHDDHGTYSEHQLAAPGWRNVTDSAHPTLLLKDDLAGHLGMVTQYRGTICKPKDEAYVLRRIRGKSSEVGERAERAIGKLEAEIVQMMRQLTPGDFEILVDMAFAAAGWRRQGVAGKNEEDVDLVLVRSSIGGVADALMGGQEERVAVQIKSETSTRTFNEVAKKLTTAYARSLFVYHTGEVSNAAHPHVELVDADRLAPMVLDAGLTRWLLRRVR